MRAFSSIKNCVLPGLENRKKNPLNQIYKNLVFEIHTIYRTYKES